MSGPPNKLLAELGEASRVSREEADALRARLPEELSPERAAHLLPAERRAPGGWALAGMAGVVAVAAAALLTVSLWPEPKADTPVQAALVSEDGGGRMAFGDTFSLTYDGQGHLDGSIEHPRIRWESGRVRVDANPDEMVDLAVITRDGEVWVEGTVFEVERDQLGTHVSVERGAVRVRCADGSAHSLEAQDEAACLPVTASGLMRRARLLQDLGRGNEEVLDTVRRGKAKSEPGSAVGTELAALEISLLAELGLQAEAVEAASSFLSSDARLRRSMVAGVALEHGLAVGDCATARLGLEELGGRAAEQDVERVEACETGAP